MDACPWTPYKKSADIATTDILYELQIITYAFTFVKQYMAECVRGQ